MHYMYMLRKSDICILIDGLTHITYFPQFSLHKDSIKNRNKTRLYAVFHNK